MTLAFEWWMVTAGANVILVVIYGLISIEMITAIIKGRQLLTNPLLTATAGVFVTCTLGHGLHLQEATLGAWGVYGATGIAAGEAVRATFSDPRLWIWDGFTAVVAIYFYTLRSRFAIVTRGAALCEDMAKREAQAMALHDEVVQGITRAKLELDMGDRAAGIKSLDQTLEASRRIVTQFLGEAGSEIALGPGDLRRSQPAGGAK